MKLTHPLLTTAIVAATLVLASPQAFAAGGAHGRVAHTGADGSIVAGGGARVGPNGGVAARAGYAGVKSDGTKVSGSGGAFKGPNGATGMRRSQTTVNPDGSASHTGSLSASGAKGNVQSNGSATRSTDGTVNADRNTTATGANGGTYAGNTSYNSTTGVQHTGTCTNASGTVVPCK